LGWFGAFFGLFLEGFGVCFWLVRFGFWVLGGVVGLFIRFDCWLCWVND